jgi:hypothetical protein
MFLVIFFIVKRATCHCARVATDLPYPNTAEVVEGGGTYRVQQGYFCFFIGGGAESVLRDTKRHDERRNTRSFFLRCLVMLADLFDSFLQ